MEIRSVETSILDSTFHKLNDINGLIFVGGTSEYLQGAKDTIRDIDVSIDDLDKLRHFGRITEAYDDSFHGLSGKRGFLHLDGILVDIFIDNILPPYIATPDGFKCQTIESMIELREKTIELGRVKGHHLEKIIQNTERLKLWHKNNPS